MKKENIENMLNNFKIVIRNDLDYLLRTQNCKDLLSYITDLQQENQKYKEVIDKVNNKLSQYKNDLKEYQEQDRINHQNISIGLVGVKIRAFEDILKEVE